MVAQQLRVEQERGYKRITFDDFKLDGRQLAAANSKVAIAGVYLKLGEVEYLFPSGLAVVMMRESPATNVGIGLLTEDANRDIRKFFLDCQNQQTGCSATLLGRATSCTRTTLVGSKNLPCLTVDDGWTSANSARY
jgi:hypothetical protein